MRNRIDRTAFERAVRDHHGAAYRAALRIARDEALALDAVQEVYRRVLAGQLDLGAARDLGRLLRCAAAREALMRLRSERARSRREAEVAMARPERFEERDPEEREGAELVARELHALPDDLRHALALRFQEGLTFAEVGDALEISEPGAHDRVRRGLAKLRDRAARLGFAGVVPDLGALLSRAEPLDVPPALEGRLLALGGGSLAGLPLVAAATGLALAAGAVFLVLRLPWDASADRDSSSALAHVTAPDPESSGASSTAEVATRLPVTGDGGRAAGAPADARSAREERGVISGRVVDDFGLAVEGAEVTASSLEREGKRSTFTATATSAVDGSFRLEVPVAVASGQDYALLARTASLVQDGGRVRVRAGEEAPFQLLRFFTSVEDRPGTWRLSLSARDPGGAPVPGAAVRVFATVRNADGAAWNRQLAGGPTDAAGEVTLSGEGLGARLLSIDARSAGWAPLDLRLELDAAEVRRDVVLRPGVELAGTIVDELGLPVPAESGARLHAVAADPNRWFEAELFEPGRWRIPALAAAPHTLRSQSTLWSSFALEGLVPGEDVELALQLKAKHDPTDFGLHGAEIHGTVLDAATGEPIPLDELETWPVRIEDASPGLVDGDWAPLFLGGVMAQRLAIDARGPAPPPRFRFVHDGLAAGRYGVRVYASGYAPAFAGPFELDPRDIAANVVVRVAGGASLAGLVRNESGRPLADAFVLVLGDGALSREKLAQRGVRNQVHPPTAPRFGCEERKGTGRCCWGMNLVPYTPLGAVRAIVHRGLERQEPVGDADHDHDVGGLSRESWWRDRPGP